MQIGNNTGRRPVAMGRSCPGRMLLAAALAAAGLCLPAARAAGADDAMAPDTGICLAANAGLSLRAGLPRAKAWLKTRLKAREPLRVVAIGSSSTRGVGASSWAASYPEVMQRELQRLRPGIAVDIINAGRNGETISGQLARFAEDVVAQRPALVIWQLGANDVVMPWGGMPDDLGSRVRTGIRALQAAGSDVILMDMQRTAFITGAPQHPAMLELIASAATQTGAGHFARFAMFGKAEAAGARLSAFHSWDGLHNSDAGYDCTGRVLARAIHAALK